MSTAKGEAGEGKNDPKIDRSPPARNFEKGVPLEFFVGAYIEGYFEEDREITPSRITNERGERR